MQKLSFLTCLLTVLAGSNILAVFATATAQKPEDAASHRRRRAIILPESLRWPKGIVPYIFKPEISSNADKVMEIKRAMLTYERFTCVRFVPWTSSTNADLGLGHDGHLNFQKGNACSAELGNKRRATGQAIHCCDEESCVHELGHALGFIHEHQSPAGHGWIRINGESIEPASLKWFLQYDDTGVVTDGFDVQSVMTYPGDSKTIAGKRYSYTSLYPELTYGTNFYYVFKEVAQAYKCAERHCQGSSITCDNDGILTQINGKCGCLCPNGLDPATGCRTIMKKVPTGTKFPGGSWGIPMTSAGCPDDSLDVGYRKEITDDDGPNAKSNPYHLNGTIGEHFAEHYFCSSNHGTAGGDDVRWEGGNYCLYSAGGACPANRDGSNEAGFMSGEIQIYDRSSSTETPTTSGTLPDGTFDSKKTFFKYCCRNDGFDKLPLMIPNRKPLALFMPRYVFTCQSIFGMHSSEEWMALNSMNFRQAKAYDETPYKKADTGLRRLHIKYCYYEPAHIDCGEMITLDPDNPTFSFTPATGDHRDCYWHVSAPVGSIIKLDLINMDVRGTMPKNCVDYVSVRAFRMGQTGIKYCGKRPLQSIISKENSMMIHFVTLKPSSSVFTASLSLIPLQHLCYSSSDNGQSYVGHVNFTRSYKPCLSWTEVTHCPHHFFSTNDIGKNLDNNYCRNPSNEFQPWCYTDVKECARDYCDVCQIGSRFDKEDNCIDFKTSGRCQTDPMAIYKCAKTCEAQLPFVRTSQDASTVRCPFPPPLPDGELTVTAKSVYNVGEVVTYRCTEENSETTDRTCLSNGQWTSTFSACSKCDAGWSVFNGKCFKLVDMKLKYEKAKAKCLEYEAKLAMPKDTATNNFLVTLRRFGTTTYIGGENPEDTTTWMWVDGTVMNWFNWKPGFPQLVVFPKQCLVLESDGKWTDGHCDFRGERFICEKAAHATSVCTDNSPTCSDVLAARPDMCTAFPDFATKSCSLTCKFCTATGCGVPPLGDGAEFVHKFSYNSQTRLPEGTQLHFACSDDTVKVSGDDVRRCQGETFSGEQLLCQRKGCEVVGPGEHVQIVSDHKAGQSVSQGTDVRYQCTTSYEKVSGNDVRTCKDGVFTGANLICQHEGCTLDIAAKESEIVSPHTSGQRVQDGTEVHFRCEEGAEHTSGDKVRNCTSGVLTGSRLVCSTVGNSSAPASFLKTTIDIVLVALIFCFLLIVK